MATKSKVVESSFRLGAGRYIQDEGAARRLGEEIKLLKCQKPYILHGKRAMEAAGEKITQSLLQNAMDAAYYEYTVFCNPNICESIVASEAFRGCDCVVGVGGGNVCDAAKLCAAMAGLPVITVPTSSATCAAYTPLSVCYNDEGQTIGTRHHKQEVNCVLADMDILCRQPVRLALAGIYDSMAKIYEINQRLLGKELDEVDIGLISSYQMSKYACDYLDRKKEECCRAFKAGECTKTVYDVVYVCIALTGVISGLARGSNQTAIAHKIYETLRFLFPQEVYDYMHGEMVAIGLIAQIHYNGEGNEEAFATTMRVLGMPTSLHEIGLSQCEKACQMLYEKILNSSAMAGTNEQEHQRLWQALQRIV